MTVAVSPDVALQLIIVSIARLHARRPSVHEWVYFIMYLRPLLPLCSLVRACLIHAVCPAYTYTRTYKAIQHNTRVVQWCSPSCVMRPDGLSSHLSINIYIYVYTFTCGLPTWVFGLLWWSHYSARPRRIRRAAIESLDIWSLRIPIVMHLSFFSFFFANSIVIIILYGCTCIRLFVCVCVFAHNNNNSK